MRKRRSTPSKNDMLRIDRISETFVNLFTALLIWLFGVLVFLPLATDVDPRRLPLLCSLIILSAFSVFIIRGIKGLGIILDFTSEILTEKLFEKRGKKKRKDQINNIKRKTNILLYSIFILLVYLFYSPFLSKIHPAMNGLAIILTLFCIFGVFLIKGKA